MKTATREEEKMPEDSREINYDESKVPRYTLPSALERPDGSRVRNAFEWMNFQRRYLLKILEENLYGPIPRRPDSMRVKELSVRENVFGGLGRRKLVRLHFEMNSGISRTLDLLVYLPKKIRGKAPVFIGLNFCGNHTATPETDLPLPAFPFPEGEGLHEPGFQKARWQPELLLKRGYALVTACYHQLYLDQKGGSLESIYSLFLSEKELRRRKEELPAISAWAWGLSRIMDYIETETELNARQVAVTGHSRLGKTALWAGANDERFALVISNDSGCGGAALSRRCFGETLGVMLSPFPHWFCCGMARYAFRSQEMPFDQHFLLSLIAPRPLYVASASEDLWADPRGEFLGLAAARDAYALFGSEGVPGNEMPPVGEVLSGDCAYHCRPGKHDITEYDWLRYLDFADRFFQTEQA